MPSAQLTVRDDAARWRVHEVLQSAPRRFTLGARRAGRRGGGARRRRWPRASRRARPFRHGSDCAYIGDSENGQRRSVLPSDIEGLTALRGCLPGSDFVMSMGLPSPSAMPNPPLVRSHEAELRVPPRTFVLEDSIRRRVEDLVARVGGGDR